ncbi:PP2C family protein-serine/threonine phosphatase [Nocardioides sp. AX2bis]|uniref:PP2C family protein-serine/threonine phosphatase n=1 Tax=Nocardioides sp. AX2bis TaxID=2653157 RepID=UPI0012F02AF2|nr:protein phosphatase 2C domain-containing protein [Nocardioides sp. AX2bis]VXC41684.1 Protein phosphatase [Nocardioides sp. AX2bis]
MTSLVLHYSAISDVGRVRKDNQDSGYAGPWLLTVCDGVGGAARGDIASSTAVKALRELDDAPEGRGDLLDRVAAGLDAAHLAIGRLVDEEPALNGTSTTSTVALFDGCRVGIGHVGDSRAYLWRSGELSQLTTDHTFVQTLVDEGRISPEEAETHPHRHVILRALDGNHDLEPDLFVLEVVPGDRLLLCSDGASGSLRADRLADILATGTPDYAAVELVRASLEAGSTDNVTCVVADVVDEATLADDPSFAELEPLLVGAASELRRRGRGVAGGMGLFRGHRSGDTGELEPVDAEIPEGVPFAIATDPETQRYAPRPPRRFAWLSRLLVLAVVVGLLWVATAAAWAWSQRQYYVGEADGQVTIFRGLDAELPGVALSEPYETSDVDVDLLSDFDANEVVEGIDAGDLESARETVQRLAEQQRTEPTTGSSTGSTTGEG